MIQIDEYINKTKFEELMRKKARNNFDLYYDEKSKHYYSTAKHYHDNAIGYNIAADEAHDFPSADVQPIDRWIDAQKNPPPIIDKKSRTSESVLILRDNGRCAVAHYCNSAEDGDYWTTDDDKTMYCWEEVTHWQPLPEPPKDGNVE